MKIDKITSKIKNYWNYAMMFPVVFAQDADRVIDLRNLGDEKYTTITSMKFPTMITGAIKFVLVIAALVFFFVLVIGGIQWIISGGDKTGAETARKRITAALVGLAIVFVAWAIGSLIKALFGFDIFDLKVPQLY